MRFQSIEEIFDANQKVREELLALLEGLSAEQQALRSENGQWTVAMIAEHLAVVEDGMGRISSKLLSKAEDKGLRFAGEVNPSEGFVSRSKVVTEEGKKFNAPEMVQPKGAQEVGESIKVLKENRRRLEDAKSNFESIDGTAFTFPHPFFGDLHAIDWLILIGEHEKRHLNQIREILARNNAATA